MSLTWFNTRRASVLRAGVRSGRRFSPTPRAADEESESATATVVQQKVQQLPPWKVILHNDEVNVMEHVVLTILKLTPLKLEEAARKTLEAHEKGLSVLLVTHRERAELYCEQFQTFKITVTCEPDV